MILILIACAAGFYTAFGIGSNDGANSMAVAVGSRAIQAFRAVLLAAVCELAGSVLVGSHVSNTVRKGIIDVHAFVGAPQFLAYGMLCALLATAVWLHFASLLGMPVSTTHSVVGAIFGFGLLWAGAQNVQWGTMVKIVASWIISPIAGGIMAFTFFKLISRQILGRARPMRAALFGAPFWVFVTFAAVTLATILKGLKHLHLDISAKDALLGSALVGLTAAGVATVLVRRFVERNGSLAYDEQLLAVERIFSPLVIITSCSVAFAHGANDVANAVGPLAAVVEIVQTHQVPHKVGIDLWVLFLGGGGIAVGLVILGHRVIRTMGMNITDLTPSRGIAADIATCIAVLAFSRLGIPISTTHTSVGSIIGVGMARGITGINLRVINSIFISWIGTIPFTAGLTILFYWIAKALFL